MVLSRQLQTKTLGENHDKVGVCCAVSVTTIRSILFLEMVNSEKTQQ